MKKAFILLMSLVVIMTANLNVMAQETAIAKASMGNNVNRSQASFITDGNWNDGSNWDTGVVPAPGSDVVIMANVIIPSGYTAVVNEVSIEGGSITVADGGQLRHNTEGLVLTMKKNIEPYSVVDGTEYYYLLCFPFSENIAVPNAMTDVEGCDFYKFDGDNPNEEWRNNRQETIATVGGITGYLYASPQPVELSLTGSTYLSYNAETKTVDIPYSNSSANLFKGWALLGNPFTCDAYIYYYDNDNQLVPMDFMVYDADGTLVTLSNRPIAPMQGFFVKVTEPTTVYIKNYQAVSSHEYVDLGLPSGTLWATCNIGSDAPENYGDYFAWGETQTKDIYNWSTYQYCNGSNNTLTKYCNNPDYGYNGFSDTLTTLLPEDDAATANWGADWRMPTKDDMQELLRNTTRTLTTQNGVNGWLFTASNGNSIFLPAAGTFSDGNNNGVGAFGYYWTSSFNTDYPYSAWYLYYRTNVSICNMSDGNRSIGRSVRPVRASIQNPSFVINATVNHSGRGTIIGGGTYQAGSTCTLTAMANEGFVFLNWAEDGEEVSTEATYSFVVNENRNLVANFGENCVGTYVDLGLPSGTLWATCNVGAEAQESYGGHFAWGETQPKDVYNWSTYQYCMGSENTLTKYCSSPDYGYNGYTDDLIYLQPEDDAATANWGEDWRMPTLSQWVELFQYTTDTWTTQNGVKGRLVVASNGNSIFLPAAGSRYESNLDNVGNFGYYWTNSNCYYYEDPRFNPQAMEVFLADPGSGGSYASCYRRSGLSVRAVRSSSQSQSYVINATANPVEGGSIVGGGSYHEGSTCTFTATANEGYVFINWTEDGEEVSTDATYSFVVNGNRNLVANFGVYCAGTYVDLGLPSGLLWATCNVGAEAKEAYGDYFAWGETQPKDTYSWNNYQHCSYGGDHNLTKYCTYSNYGYNGFTDYLTTLLPDDDAATVNLGSDWRMPTIAEWQELFDNTNHTWITQNGVEGYLVTASNGNSIFLPVRNYESYYWSSSLLASNPSFADEFTFDQGAAIGYFDEGNRAFGRPVRAVRCKNSEINVSVYSTVCGSVSGGGTYFDGINCTVTATANDGYTFIGWVEDGATVSVEASYSFRVSGNRNLVAYFYNYVSGANHYVDLGLPSGLLWATCNVGAETPEGYGNYYAWGETQPKSTYNWSTYQYCNGSSNTLTKYCNRASYGYNGFTDNLTTLLPEDDAATANWGAEWRMPTHGEWQELFDNTTYIWAILNGVVGRLFTASNGNSLFLPVAGNRHVSSLISSGSVGYYWSSSLQYNPDDAWNYSFSYNSYSYNSNRSYGRSVRAVYPLTQNTAPTGAIDSKFTINGDGDQVYFSQGNLQYQASTNTWKFAESQYDYIGDANSNISSSYDGWIDLFGWGTSGYHDANDPYNVNYQPWSSSDSELNNDYNTYGYGPSTNMPDMNLTGTSANYDWGVNNPISNGGNTANQWRTLTQPEWSYVLNTRNTTSGIRFAKAQVNEVNGVILLPDDWTTDTYNLNNTNNIGASYNSNVINASQWAMIENAGGVFLPAAGGRFGTTVADVGSTGFYWLSSSNSSCCAYYVYIYNFGIYLVDYRRYLGRSVRLVCDVES